jgi:hypothetical protein
MKKRMTMLSKIGSYTNSTLILRVASIAYLLHSNELMILYRASSNWNAYYGRLKSVLRPSNSTA